MMPEMLEGLPPGPFIRAIIICRICISSIDWGPEDSMPLRAAMPPRVWSASGETPVDGPFPDQDDGKRPLWPWKFPKASEALRVWPARPGTGPRRLAGEYTHSNASRGMPSMLFVLFSERSVGFF